MDTLSIRHDQMMRLFSGKEGKSKQERGRAEYSYGGGDSLCGWGDFGTD